MRTYTSNTGKRAPDRPLLSFELDGVEFVAENEMSILDATEFARLATAGVDSESPAGAAMISEIFIAILGDKGYQRLRTHTRAHHTDPKVIVAIIGDLMEDLSARPTSAPSDSSDGQTSTPPTSTVVSFSRGTVSTAKEPLEGNVVQPKVRTFG